MHAYIAKLGLHVMNHVLSARTRHNGAHMCLFMNFPKIFLAVSAAHPKATSHPLITGAVGAFEARFGILLLALDALVGGCHGVFFLVVFDRALANLRSVTNERFQ